MFELRPAASCAAVLRKIGFHLLLLFIALASNGTARAGLLFNVTFDSTTSTAPAGFFTAFNDAIQFFEATYSDPITINLQVGWGKINGNNLNPGNLGQTS